MRPSQDITIRALNVLQSVNLVLAEDTRHTGKLLSAYGIKTSMASCHEHNEKGRGKQVVARMQAGEVRWGGRGWGDGGAIGRMSRLSG